MRLSAWPVLLLLGPIVGRALAQTSNETASCQERCDESYFPGKPCYCNAACDQYENCCYDYYQICAPDQVWVDEWVQYENHLYKFYRDQTASGAEAADLCKQHGALLASINSQLEMEFIGDKVLRKRTLGAFIGGLRGEDNTWQWADGSAIATPSDEWNEWYDGHPADGDCSVVTNYKFWDVSKFKLESYQWRSFSCDVNVGKTIPGYICEATVLCSSNPCENNGTCSYVGELVSKSGYTCSCLDGFLGEHCQYQVEDGEPWTFCGDTTFTSPKGVISSPLYPQSYPPNVRCQWLIQVEANKTLSLFLDSLDLENSKDCVFDKVLIYDGPSKNVTLLKKPLCGYLHQNLNTSQMITSSTNEVLIEMQTDYSVERGGFHMSYSQQDCGLGTGDSGCGTRRKFTSSCGSIGILNPNDYGTTCQLDIIAPAGHIVNLTVVEFYIPESDQKCLDSYVAFHDSDKADDPLLGRYCGWRFPWSLQSSGSELHITMNTSATEWLLGSHRVEIRYQFVETAMWRRQNPDVILADGDGTWSSRDYPVQVVTSEHVIQEWIVRVPIGERLKITWSASFQASTASSLGIYDGFSAESGHLLHTTETSSGEIVASSFQARVRFTRALDDNTSAINIDYQTLSWDPELSGCYRPLYHDKTSTPETENNLVTTLEPVTVMVSENVYGSKNTPSYGPGLYCKWRIQAGTEAPGLAVSFLDAVIPPLSENCDYDGLVLYGTKSTAETKYGPFCGGNSGNKGTTFRDLVFTEEEDIVVVFYSDRRPGERAGGIVRAVVTPSDLGECRVDAMDKETSNVLESACGTVLSPAFPGLVQPGQWLWTIQGPPEAYFNVYVFYIRGPGLPADEECRQSFTVLEISQDSGLLRQNEAHIMRVCGDTDLFVPAKRLKMPPHQKVGLELNTATSGSPQQWQFKIAYKSDVMLEPKHTEDLTECPDEYVFYNNFCYRYYPWVLRHYRDEYSFTETWQKSLEHCEMENATLFSVKDEEEAYFVKHTFSDAWFWDPASSFQQNHRMIFMGLHDKYGKYEWTDGTALSYADWYVPDNTWQQPVLHEDTEGTSFLNLQKSQPTADIGSLCTAIIVTSPFQSLHWAKIPCDYPIFRAGAICKKPATNETNALRPQRTLPLSVGPITVCPEGWLMVAGRCLHLYTDYTAARVARKAGPDSSIIFSRENATSTCDNLGGHPAEVSHAFLGHLVMYFKIWRLTPEMGSMWISNDGESSCRVIEVTALHSQDEDYQYTVRKTACGTKKAFSVLCETDAVQRVEECAAHEFRCSDGVCISVDGVCDGHADCATGSDEQNCGCGVDSFTCENGRCIPVSLYCDFIDHCGDNSDEDSCQLERCRPDEFQCRSGQCVPETARCDFKLQCSDASDEDASLCDNQCQGLLCYSGHCLHPKLQSDLISDCPGMSGEDELDNTDGLITFFDLLINGVSISNDTAHFGCEAGGQSQCRTDHDRCYNRADTCVYDTERIDERSLIPVQASCRDGAHLRAKCEAASCPGMYHCQGSYCLPVRKLCDGIPDCPLGDDEQDCHNFTCPGMLKCKASGTCVPHSEVCDGVLHCPVHGEDEKYCQPADPLCGTPGCNCTGLVATCSNLATTDLTLTTDQGETRTLRALVITGSTLQLTIESFQKLHWLAKLVLNHNKLDSLPSGVFADLRNLYELDLSQNDIRVIDANVFDGLDSLTHLYLNDNKLNSLNSAILEPLVKLKHLNLKQNGFSDVKKDTFQYSKSLRVLHSDDYKFCCIADQVETCTPEADEFSSCEDLMANYALQVSIWVLGFLAFLGNIFVIGWRILKDRSRASSFFIINLSCSDLLMGMYLLIIASVDVYYRGTYILHAESWRTSILCQFAGILAMLSSEVSVFMLTAITMDRVVSIAFPLKFGQIRMKQARIVAAFTWSFCLLLSLIPVSGIEYFGDSFFGRTGVCLPFQISNDRLPGWEYSVFIFLVLNFISFIVILIGYVAIFLTVKSSVKRFGGSATATTDEYALAKKVSLIVATDFLCWVPIILIGFAALGGAQISPRVSAWIAVFVLPLNSSLNPLLYTISSLDCRSKRRRQAGHTNSSVSGKTCSTVAVTTKQAYRDAYSADSDIPETAAEMKAIKIGVSENGDKQKAAPPTYDESANEA